MGARGWVLFREVGRIFLQVGPSSISFYFIKIKQEVRVHSLTCSNKLQVSFMAEKKTLK